MLGLASQADDVRRGKKLVRRSARTLKKAMKIHAGVVRKGALSPKCAAALKDVLTKAVGKCQTWRSSFCVE
jgi:hypothetical protein